MGVVLLLIAFTMDTSVGPSYGRVHNIGLLSKQNNYIILGSILLVGGLIISAFKGSSNQPSNEGTIKCPFCAELIKKNAKLCKHCKSPIPELSSVTQPTNADLSEIINPTIEDKPESPSASNLSIPQPTPTIDRSSLNKSYAEEFNSYLSEGQIKSALACELDKITKGFNPETLLGFKGKNVVTEATLLKIEDNKWKIKIDFSEKSKYWLVSKISISALVVSAIAGLPTLFVAILIIWPIIIVLVNVIYIGDTTKIKNAVESFKHSIQNIQSKPEGTSSSLYSLNLISVGDKADEVKAVIRKTLGLGVNDTNDLIRETLHK